VITPQQTLATLNKLTSSLHFTLVLTCAATALRASEIVSLRWSDILWTDEQIRISKRWAKGKDGETKTAASNGYVPMHLALAKYLQEWRAQSPYSKIDDFVFPSLIKDGKVPVRASTFVQDHLRPAAISAGVVLAKGQRFGLHNLRHSLSTWLVIKGKVDPISHCTRQRPSPRSGKDRLPAVKAAGPTVSGNLVVDRTDSIASAASLPPPELQRSRQDNRGKSILDECFCLRSPMTEILGRWPACRSLYVLLAHSSISRASEDRTITGEENLDCTPLSAVIVIVTFRPPRRMAFAGRRSCTLLSSSCP
jgi:integrase-like protein